MNDQLRSNELPEYPISGPFAGIQSEAPFDRFEASGNAFLDLNNIMLRKSGMFSGPPVLTLPALPNGDVGPIVGVADFFDATGARHQVVMSQTSLYMYMNGSWTQITGALSGGSVQFFTADCVGEKLYFSQGVDKVQVWDGIAANFSVSSPSAVPARYVFEVANHLLAGYTVEGAAIAPQRLRWTGAGDGTDWTSFNAGQTDLFNNFGPITGGLKIFQYGYAFQQWGITQIIPTGIGTQPFDFLALGSKAKGNIAPYSLASFGEAIACYVGKDDIYLFDGTSSTPIGSRPLDGNLRLGARQRIFQDLIVVDLNQVHGFISTSLDGNDYEAYWLILPSGIMWVYHFDEGSWTQINLTLPTRPTITSVGTFSKNSIPRIQDLIGTIATQTWSPATLTGSNPLDSMFVGYQDGSSGIVTMNQPASQPWSWESGQHFFGDDRHEHTVKKIRFKLMDFGQTTITIILYADNDTLGQSRTLTYGTGSGNIITRVVEFGLKGRWFKLFVTGAAGTQFGMSSYSFIYDTAGEVRGDSGVVVQSTGSTSQVVAS